MLRRDEEPRASQVGGGRGPAQDGRPGKAAEMTRRHGPSGWRGWGADWGELRA